MSELKSCPFCGGEPKLMQAWVECKKCRAMTAVSGTRNDAISAWNRRPNQWIPVSERLPKVDKYGDIGVLVHMDDGFISTATYDKNNGWELWADAGEVTHWMPLPQPPVGGAK